MLDEFPRLPVLLLFAALLAEQLLLLALAKLLLPLLFDMLLEFDGNPDVPADVVLLLLPPLLPEL